MNLRIKKNANSIIGIVLTAIVVIPAIIGIFWTPYDPETINGSLKLAGASWAHPFGCDNFGRDILSRIMLGSSTTFLIGMGTVIGGAVVGTLVGALTGFYGGVIDEVLMRFNDVMLSFPSLLLALTFVAIFGPGKYRVMWALAIAFVPSFARIIRAEFKRVKNMDYVKAARLSGASDFRIMYVHILPNTMKVLINAVLIGFNNAVLAEAGLSFLGIGVQPPDASLGRMLSDSQTYLFTKPSYAIIPGMAIIVMVLGVSMIGKEVE